MVKLMVLSRTYRQSSQGDPQRRERDPNNRWLARQDCFRLDAEFVRDNALAVSGLLSPKIGGPSVKPYQPAHTFMNTGSTISGRPSMGAWLLYGLGSESENLPGFVVLTSVGKGGQSQPIAARQWHSGFLPSRHQGVEFRSKGDAVLYVSPPAGVGLARQRGMLDDTLVIWGGEFGRTPMAQGNGRDHHIKGFSFWMAGGGVKGGVAYGGTDELGYNAVEDVVHVHDLHATMLHLLGIDHQRLTFRAQGRDFRLTDVFGNVVEPLLA